MCLYDNQYDSLMEKRSAGVLLPVSSLPSEYGIGCFSESAYQFIDQLERAGQSFWQILPLGPTGYGDSPYQSFSTFAGNPYYISLKALIKEGVLAKDECEEGMEDGNPSFVDYEQIYRVRFKLLREAYERSAIEKNPDFIGFCQEQKWWLDDYALFMALKDFFGGRSWIEWPQDIRLRQDSALGSYRRELHGDIEFYQYLQFKFNEQWQQLKQYANAHKIHIIGDIPIYVAFDSADTWSAPWLFQLDEDNQPTAVAGCPPDPFSETGQLWGNPLYRWDYHRQQGYWWWIQRVKHCFVWYDVLRIDHFRGFDEYYSIPYGEMTAENGHWEKGPGIELFHAIHQKLGKKPIIAEDLGFITDSVRELVKASGYPNMKVLEFAFDSRDTGNANGYLPHNYERNCVVYTGTHDNATLCEWFKQILPEERQMLRDYLHDEQTPDKDIYKEIICLAMQSVANICIIPMQDYLGYGGEARMNIPSTLGMNWRWRLRKGEIVDGLLSEIKRLTETYGRV